MPAANATGRKSAMLVALLLVAFVASACGKSTPINNAYFTAQPLMPGVAAVVTLAGETTTATFYYDIPEQVAQASLQLTLNGISDFTAVVRHNTVPSGANEACPVGYPALSEYECFSFTQPANELVVPMPRAGRWFITVFPTLPAGAKQAPTLGVTLQTLDCGSLLGGQQCQYAVSDATASAGQQVSGNVPAGGWHYDRYLVPADVEYLRYSLINSSCSGQLGGEVLLRWGNTPTVDAFDIKLSCSDTGEGFDYWLAPPQGYVYVGYYAGGAAASWNYTSEMDIDSLCPAGTAGSYCSTSNPDASPLLCPLPDIVGCPFEEVGVDISAAAGAALQFNYTVGGAVMSYVSAALADPLYALAAVVTPLPSTPLPAGFTYTAVLHRGVFPAISTAYPFLSLYPVQGSADATQPVVSIQFLYPEADTYVVAIYSNYSGPAPATPITFSVELVVEQCPADCYAIQKQGTCTASTLTCACKRGFTGPDCGTLVPVKKRHHHHSDSVGLGVGLTFGFLCICCTLVIGAAAFAYYYHHYVKRLPLFSDYVRLQ